jgi:very-short-patch-repair endonuclease
MIKTISPPEGRTKQLFLRYNDGLRILARKNRNNPTPSERIFWQVISNKDKLKWRFLRQKPIGRCILDFYCPRLMINIEIDGDSHDYKKYWDKARDEYLETRGIMVIRYRDEEILYHPEVVFKNLEKIINDRASTLFIKEGRCDDRSNGEI